MVEESLNDCMPLKMGYGVILSAVRARVLLRNGAPRGVRIVNGLKIEPVETR